uniref:Uncharacterized protein n=1 Tax=Anguilla anguilla TaxID=7936 RepID=A0A0E9TI33_ANGAN
MCYILQGHIFMCHCVLHLKAKAITLLGSTF